MKNVRSAWCLVSMVFLMLTVENKVIDQLPIRGRNPYNVATLDPTVSPGNGSTSNENRPYHHAYASDIDVGGQTTRANDVLLDGVPLVSSYKSSYTPALDAVQEVTFQKNAIDSEYGYSAGGVIVLNMVESVVDIDGPVTFIDPGNIEKEKKGPYDTNTRLIGGTFEEKPDVWREASPITHVNSKSAPVLFINSSSYRPFQQREEMRDKLNALGIVSEIVVIPDTPHPFWLFHPWFDSTVEYVDEFLQRTMKRVQR